MAMYMIISHGHVIASEGSLSKAKNKAKTLAMHFGHPLEVAKHTTIFDESGEELSLTSKKKLKKVV